jgi:hypothetical protein
MQVDKRAKRASRAKVRKKKKRKKEKENGAQIIHYKNTFLLYK